jgi:hypothetical protein
MISPKRCWFGSFVDAAEVPQQQQLNDRTGSAVRGYLAELRAGGFYKSFADATNSIRLSGVGDEAL